MNIVSKVMEKSWKFVGKNVYEPCSIKGIVYPKKMQIIM